MPKVKTKSGAKIKRKCAYHSHILTKKSTKRKRNLVHGHLVSKADESNVRAMLKI
jgi:large subunit ribosomal protein L35